MKKRKGFTLVELLAVIAILAILVIMALPAVLRMYRQSKINSFQNEVRGVYKTAQTQFLSDSMLLNAGGKVAYTSEDATVSEATMTKKLEMTGNFNFKYYILMDTDGKVLIVRATNGTYSYSKTGTDIKIEEIIVDDEEKNDVALDSNISGTLLSASSGSGETGDNNNSSTSSYLYSISYTGQNVGDTLMVDNVDVFDNYDDAINEYRSRDHVNNEIVVTAHKINNNVITNSYLAFKKDGTINYLKAENKTLQYSITDIDACTNYIYDRMIVGLSASNIEALEALCNNETIEIECDEPECRCENKANCNYFTSIAEAIEYNLISSDDYIEAGLSNVTNSSFGESIASLDKIFGKEQCSLVINEENDSDKYYECSASIGFFSANLDGIFAQKHVNTGCGVNFSGHSYCSRK